MSDITVPDNISDTLNERIKSLPEKARERLRRRARLMEDRLREPTLAQREFTRVLFREGETHWTGGISRKDTSHGAPTYDPKPGMFFTPARLDPQMLPPRGSKGWKVGRGVGKAAVVSLPIVMAEIDDYGLTEQIILIALLIEEGMPEPSAIVFSGGKSLHLFWRLDVPYGPDEVDRWQWCQRVLIAVLGGDKSITDPCRRMRLGMGVEGTRQFGTFEIYGPVHRQPILHVRHDEVDRGEFEAWLQKQAHLLPDDDDPKTPGAKRRSSGRLTTGGASGVRHREYVDLEARFPRLLRSVVHGEKCPAPCFNHDDATASGFLSCTRDRRRFFTCPQVCQTTWFHDSDERLPTITFDRSFSMDLAVTAECRFPKEEITLRCDTSPIWEDRFLTQDGYLDMGGIPPARAQILCVGTGTGKTEAATTLAAEVSEQDDSIVAIAPLRTLTSGLHQRLLDKGCQTAHYRDVDGELIPPVTLCFPSARRVRWLSINEDGTMLYTPFSLVIWDESESSLRGLMGHLDGPQGSQAYTSLVDILSQAQSILLLDGHAGPCTRLLLRHAELEDDCVWVQPPREPRYEWVFHSHRRTLDADLMASALSGARIGIACASANHALALGALIDSESTLRVGVISPRVGETVSNKEGEPEVDRVGLFDSSGRFDEAASAACSLDDLGWVDKVDVLLLTWAAGTGVDIKGTWDRVAYIGCSVEHSVSHVRQMLGRWRDVRSNEVHVFAHRGQRPATWEVDPKWVLDQWQDQRKTYSQIRLLDDVDPTIRDENVRQYRDMCACVVAADRAEGAGWLRQALEVDARDAGERFAEVPGTPRQTKMEKAVSTAIKGWKEVHANAQAEEIIKAPRLDLDSLEELRDRGPASVHEAKLLRRQGFDDFYGQSYIDSLDEDALARLLKEDRHGQRRFNLRALGVALALRQRRRHQIVAAYDKADMERENLRPDRLHSRLLRGGLLIRYFRAAGIELNEVADGTLITDEMCHAGLKWLKTTRWLSEFVKEVGVPESGKRSGAVRRFMGDCLARIGMRAVRKQRRVNGRRTNEYILGGAARARRQVDHYVCGLLNPPVDSPAHDAARLAFMQWLEANPDLLGI